MKHLVMLWLAPAILILATAMASAQPFGWQVQCSDGCGTSQCPAGKCVAVDLMDTRNFKLRDYRQMFISGSTPTPEELIGTWRGVNKGVVTLVGYKQFVKEIKLTECGLYGENIKVHQVNRDCVRQLGWKPKLDQDGDVQYHDPFQIQSPSGVGRFGHGTVFSYRDGGNRRLAPSRLLVDRVVKVDQNHLVGRVVVRTLAGPIPVAYFMLERVH